MGSGRRVDAERSRAPTRPAVDHGQARLVRCGRRGRRPQWPRRGDRCSRAPACRCCSSKRTRAWAEARAPRSSRSPAIFTMSARPFTPWRARRLSFAPCRSRNSVSSGSIRPSLSRILSTTERRPCFDTSLEATASGLGARCATPTATLRGRSFVTTSAFSPSSWARCVCPSIRCLLAQFGLRAIRSAQGLADAHFRNRLRARPLRRVRRACDSSFRSSCHRRDRSGAPAGRARARLALSARWLRIDRACARGPFRHPGRRDRNREPGSIARELPSPEVVLFDVTPRQLVAICGDRSSLGLPRRLAQYRYGPGVFKLDWALDGPIPWRRRAARERPRFTSAERSKRSPTPKPPSGAASTPSGPMCSSPSKAYSMTRVLRRASTPVGPIVTCLTARRST